MTGSRTSRAFCTTRNIIRSVMSFVISATETIAMTLPHALAKTRSTTPSTKETGRCTRGGARGAQRPRVEQGHSRATPSTNLTRLCTRGTRGERVASRTRPLNFSASFCAVTGSRTSRAFCTTRVPEVQLGQRPRGAQRPRVEQVYSHTTPRTKVTGRCMR